MTGQKTKPTSCQQTCMFVRERDVSTNRGIYIPDVVLPTHAKLSTLVQSGKNMIPVRQHTFPSGAVVACANGICHSAQTIVKNCSFRRTLTLAFAPCSYSNTPISSGRTSAYVHRCPCFRPLGSRYMRHAAHGGLDRARLAAISRYQRCCHVPLVLHREVRAIDVIWVGHRESMVHALSIKNHKEQWKKSIEANLKYLE